MYKPQHRMYKSYTSYVQTSNRVCTILVHRMYKSHISYVQTSFIVCTILVHRMYKSRTSYVQISRIVCSILIHRMYTSRTSYVHIVCRDKSSYQHKLRDTNYPKTRFVERVSDSPMYAPPAMQHEGCIN